MLRFHKTHGGLHLLARAQGAKALAVAPSAATTHNGQIKATKLPAALTSALKKLLVRRDAKSKDVTGSNMFELRSGLGKKLT